MEPFFDNLLKLAESDPAVALFTPNVDLNETEVGPWSDTTSVSSDSDPASSDKESRYPNCSVWLSPRNDQELSAIPA